MLEAFLFSLGLTLVVELTVAFCWGLRRRDLRLAALVNVLTNPAVLLLHLQFPPWYFTLSWEGAAWAVEACYYRRYGRDITSPWLLALTANLSSYAAGLFVSGRYPI